MPRPSASATAYRFAAQWVADALAADGSLDFSSFMALLGASPESLSADPESVTRERVALRCLQELSAAATGDGPTASRAPAGMLRVDITRSCEDLLLQIIGEVGTSGSLKKDMLLGFSQDIQNIICIKKPRLPATCFQLLREVDREIACVALPSTVEQNGDNEHDQLNIEEPRFPTDSAILRVENLAKFNQTYKENIFKESIEPTSDLQQGCISDTTIPRVDSNKTCLSSPQHDSGENANQDLDYEGTDIQPVEKDSIPVELALRAGSVLPSVRCNGAIQGDKSETNHLVGNSKEHDVLYEQLNDGNCHLEVCCADKVNQSLFSDGGVLEKNMAVCGGLSVQSASGPRNCSVDLHNKISEDSYLFKQNNAKRTTDVQKLSCSITVPVPRDGDGRRANQISNKETLANTVVEISDHSDDSLSVFADKMSFCIKDRGTSSYPRGCSEKDLCIKCGKDNQLLKCNSCLLAAHESCFGPSLTFEDSGEFCCPVCFYTKATEAYKEAKKTYCEARKKVAAFFGTQQSINQHDEQPPEVLPRASPQNLNGYSLLTRKSIHQTETHRLACSDEKDDQQRKKQKLNGPVDTCPEETVTGKAPSVRNSDVEPMNKHPVLQNTSKKVHDTEKEHQVETTKSCEEARNENSCDGTGNTSHEKCDPSAKNQEVEADREDGLTNSNRSENSCETEAISLNDSGQQSLPTLHIRHHKARSRERETLVPCNSGKAFVHQGENMPSPSRKRSNAYPINRLSSQVTPTGRRSKLSWTDEEEAALREAMETFKPQGNRPIPWIQILEYGRHVFHCARLPCDLRVKWRNIMKKAGS